MNYNRGFMIGVVAEKCLININEAMLLHEEVKHKLKMIFESRTADYNGRSSSGYINIMDMYGALKEMSERVSQMRYNDVALKDLVSEAKKNISAMLEACNGLYDLYRSIINRNDTLREGFSEDTSEELIQKVLLSRAKETVKKIAILNEINKGILFRMSNRASKYTKEYIH